MKLKLTAFIQELITVKDAAHVIDLDECNAIGNHWLVVFVKSNKVTIFDSFGVEHIPRQLYELMSYAIHACDLIKYECFVLDLSILC